MTAADLGSVVISIPSPSVALKRTSILINFSDHQKHFCVSILL
jgi:hypothetical protein